MDVVDTHAAGDRQQHRCQQQKCGSGVQRQTDHQKRKHAHQQKGIRVVLENRHDGCGSFCNPRQDQHIVDDLDGRNQQEQAGGQARRTARGFHKAGKGQAAEHKGAQKRRVHHRHAAGLGRCKSARHGAEYDKTRQTEHQQSITD